MMRTIMAQNQLEKVTVTDSKVTKFQVMVNEISSYLYQPQVGGGLLRALFYTPLFSFGENSDAKFYFPACLKNYTNNPFVRVLNSSLTQKVGMATGPLFAATLSCNPDKVTLSELDVINIYQRDKSKHQTKCYAIIFWMLFTTAIDDEIYNNELAGIIDLAYNLDFSEEMIRDWCRAIEYVLDGNHLSEDCDLVCKTVEGKKFFLHK